MSDDITTQLTELYASKVTCIVCQHKFTSMKVRSRFAIVSHTDSDFCPHYKEGAPNPNFYRVTVCPECGFSFVNDFSPVVAEKTRLEIQEKLTNKMVKRNFCDKRDINQAIDTYKLAIYCTMLKPEKSASVALLYLQLAWLYRYLENAQEEERFLRLAIKKFEESYVTSDFAGTSLTEIKVLYFIGDLLKRVGELNEAVRYFDKVVRHPDINRERVLLVKAREQWTSAVELFRNKNKQS